MLNLKKYLTSSKSGQVVIKLKGEPHLCKVSVENGHVVYISIGNKTPLETIEYLKNKEIENMNFIEGIKPLKKTDTSITEAVLKVFGIEELSDTTVGLDLRENEQVHFGKVQSVIDQFIDDIGPLGPALLDNIFKEIHYEMGKPMDGVMFSEFVSYLINEMPEEKREAFKNKIL